MNENYYKTTNSISSPIIADGLKIDKLDGLKIDKLVSFDFNLVNLHTITTIPFVEDIEIILSPDATIIKNNHNKTKTIVKKYEDDTENRELAVTFGLLKNLGITPAQVQRMMANAKDYREPKKGKKNEKKNSND